MSGSPFPNEADWHAVRARYIGGSEIAALFDAQPPYALSRYALWHVKAGNVPPPDVGNERTFWGQRLEAAIAEAAAEREGWTIAKGGHVPDPEGSGLAVTLDYRILLAPDRAGAGVLEIKNADWMVHRRSWTGEEPPLHILLQLQAQLLCTGCAWGVVACLVGGNNLQLYSFNARPKLQAEMRHRARQFWYSIREGREPLIDGSDEATEVLRALYPERDDEVADLTHVNDGPEICAEFLRAAEAKREASAAYDLARNRLAQVMGAHKAAEFTGFRVRMAVTEAKPDREAMPGEIIKGRAESVRFTVKERVEA